MAKVKVTKPYMGLEPGAILDANSAQAKAGIQFKSAERVSDEDASKLTEALAKADADAAKAKAEALAGAPAPKQQAPKNR